MFFLRNSRLVRKLKGLMAKHMHNMISCEEFEGFITDYLGGELPAEKKAVFEFHMKLCPECREYLAAYRRSMELGQAVLGEASDPVPEDVPEDLIRAIIEARKK